jgi:hypothetical protein
LEGLEELAHPIDKIDIASHGTKVPAKDIALEKVLKLQIRRRRAFINPSELLDEFLVLQRHPAGGLRALVLGGDCQDLNGDQADHQRKIGVHHEEQLTQISTATEIEGLPQGTCQGAVLVVHIAIDNFE